MVSPLDKNGGDIRALAPFAGGLYASFKQSSYDGEAITYTSGTAFGDAVAGHWSNQYLSSRGSDGWATHGISPARGRAAFEGNGLPPPNWETENLFEAFTLDLCNAWFRDSSVPPLAPGALEGYVNLYRRSNCGGEGYEVLSGGGGPFGPATAYLNDAGEIGIGLGPGPGLRFQGASEDLSHQVFIAGAPLLPDPLGMQIRCSSPTSATTTSFQWLRNGLPIEGATFSTYTTTAADEGTAIQCQVFATNPNAGSTQVANAARIVAPAPAVLPPLAPNSIPAPTASAPLAVGGPGGQTLTCDPNAAGWSHATTFSYKWYRNGTLIIGADSPTYTVTVADLATRAAFQCAVTGSNAGGAVVKVSIHLLTDPGPSPAPPGGNKSTVVANMDKKSQLYDLHDGELELVGILPDGTPNPESSVAGTLGSPVVGRASNVEHVVSRNGSRIFWTAKSGNSTQGPGPIYVRVNGETTLPVSESVSPADARYWTAAADGSAMLFTVGETLYEFNVDDAIAGDPEPARTIAGQVPGMLGAADDLSRIYFVSREALAAGSVAGEWNLFFKEADRIVLVAVLSDDDAESHVVGISPVRADPISRTSRITSDGRHIAFQALASLTGYDNTDSAGKRYTEVYHYDADTDELTCVSCNRGGPPTGGPPIRVPYNMYDKELEGNSFPTRFGEAGTLPTWEREQYASRALSEDGSRVFFHSHEALVTGDTNGVKDVYQWEAQGTGTCEQAGGCVDLISTGTSSQVAEFVDASADGDDVFITTASSIDPRDPGSVDLYDARVGGGLPVPPPPPDCLPANCRPSPSPPGGPTPTSATFRGPGNPPLRRGCRPLARRSIKLNRLAKRTNAPRLDERAKQARKRLRRCRHANRRGTR